jgi:hypothetical protein
MDLDRPRSLGPTCPACGRPSRPGATRCAGCGCAAGEAGPHAGLLTVFGCGLCGFLAGATVGVALVAVTTTGPALAHAATLAGLGLGVIGWGLASQVGRRLHLGVRCAYEHLLLALDGAGVAALVVALAGVERGETVALTWVAAGSFIFGLLRRYGYGVRR